MGAERQVDGTTICLSLAPTSCLELSQYCLRIVERNLCRCRGEVMMGSDKNPTPSIEEIWTWFRGMMCVNHRRHWDNQESCCCWCTMKWYPCIGFMYCYTCGHQWQVCLVYEHMLCVLLTFICDVGGHGKNSNPTVEGKLTWFHGMMCVNRIRHWDYQKSCCWCCTRLQVVSMHWIYVLLVLWTSMTSMLSLWTHVVRSSNFHLWCPGTWQESPWMTEWPPRGTKWCRNSLNDSGGIFTIWDGIHDHDDQDTHRRGVNGSYHVEWNGMETQIIVKRLSNLFSKKKLKHWQDFGN